MVVFEEENHRYYSPDDIWQDWVSVTTLIYVLCPPFSNTPEKCSARKPGRYPNKWYGLPPNEIQQAWDNENKRSTVLGKFYHQQREDSWIESGQASFCEWRDGLKYSLPQELTSGVYIEFITYLQSAGITGQVDKIEVRNNILNINDYKTSKEIRRNGFTNWEGITTMMLGPVSHLEDCEFNHYSLQLSLYAYMLLRHNPQLTLGELTIEHVKFETDGVDKYQYPITRYNDRGEPIVKGIEYIKCPYLKNEVVAMLQWVKEPKNRITVVKHI